MSKINLLPWREELRKELNKKFAFEFGKTIGLSLIVVIMVHFYCYYRITVDESNINYIRNETKKIDGKISELTRLRENKRKLLEKVHVIQMLQADRFSVVRLFDALPRVIPEGIILLEFSRKEVQDIAKGKDTKAEDKKASNAASKKKATTPAPEKGQDSGGVPLANKTGMNSVSSASGAVGGSERNKKKYLVTLKGSVVASNSISQLLKNLEKFIWISESELKEINKSKVGDGFDFQINFIQTSEGSE